MKRHLLTFCLLLSLLWQVGTAAQQQVPSASLTADMRLWAKDAVGTWTPVVLDASGNLPASANGGFGASAGPQLAPSASTTTDARLWGQNAAGFWVPVVLDSTGHLPTTGVPAGSDTYVQFNDGGAFGGDAGLTYDKATDILTTVGGIDVAAAGVRATAANGILTLLGLGTGADENLVIDLNTTANTIALSSGTGATNLTFAGVITGTYLVSNNTIQVNGGGGPGFSGVGATILTAVPGSGTFARLNLGGTTASFPSWAVSGTTIQAKLADASAYTAVEGSKYSTLGANAQASVIQQATVSLTTDSGAATATATALIPAGSLVIVVDARVTTILAGAGLTTWSLGDGSDADRWAIGKALAAGTTVTLADATITSAPIYAAATDVVLTAAAGQFDSGVIRLTVHYVSITAATS